MTLEIPCSYYSLSQKMRCEPFSTEKPATTKKKHLHNTFQLYILVITDHLLPLLYYAVLAVLRLQYASSSSPSLQISQDIIILSFACPTTHY